MDPLRPFADLIRSLWRMRTTAVSAPSRPASVADARDQPSASRAKEPLQSRLKARIGRVDSSDPRKVREAFVETVLLWEFGDQLARDPAFGEMVASVSEHLGSDAAVSEKLHRTLSRLAAASGE